MRRHGSVPRLLALGLLLLTLGTPALPARAAPVPPSSCEVLPAGNVWNTDISQLPVHPRSSDWLNSTGGPSRLLHPDFGAPPYGIPVNVVDSSHATASLRFDYQAESDPGPYPLGPDIQVEGTPGDGGDDHALIVNRDTCRLYEIYNAGRGDGTAGSGAVWDLRSNALRPAGWTSADAAGLPILPGLVRYDEVQAGAINHALRFTVQRTDRSFLWPARHQAGSAADPTLPPMGARFRLRAGFDTSGFSPDALVILNAMKRYGMIVADNGSNWYFTGTRDSRWDDALLSQLKRIPAGQFEAVDESSLMGDPNSGATTGASCGSAPAAGAATAGTTTSFYFAEGFTGPGFKECLALLMPNASGVAAIDYYTEQGHQPTQYVTVNAGQVAHVDVNAAVGPGHQVSIRTSLPSPGVVERKLSFQGRWRGSTDLVGTAAPAPEWDFAEGSTLSAFSEYLTLQNPNPAPVTVDLLYGTDAGSHPTKTLTLPPLTRATVEVFRGDLNDDPACEVATGSCGIGPGIQGVSVQVRVRGEAAIVAERPLYVNGHSFGSGPISDGHDAFGAPAAGTRWNFAEGTTLAGFNEYIALHNPGLATADVTLTYLSVSGSTSVRTLPVGPRSRATVRVFDPTDGVGPGQPGVSVQVGSDQPVVAERPMYIVHDFGGGIVSGAHDAVGSAGLGRLFGFAQASTAAGDYDYLTIQNPGSEAVNLTLTYYGGGTPVTRTLSVRPTSRHTIELFNPAEGPGPGLTDLGIVIAADQPVLVEKPTYSTAGTGGATDTIGYSPVSGSF